MMNNRAKNLTILIDIAGTQRELANLLTSQALTQQILSSIERGKRPMYELEARSIENDLVIPIGWLDLDTWQQDGWGLIKEYRALDDHGKATFNKLYSFLKKRCK
jgi:hypothetical protein